MRLLFATLLAMPLVAQNYASYNNTPVARVSFLRHQFAPTYNALGDSSLVGYWPVDEGAGSVMYDESSSGLNANWNGTQAGTLGYYSSGKTSLFSGYFNGSNDYSVTSNSITLASSFSVCTWIYPIGTQTNSPRIIETKYNGQFSVVIGSSGTSYLISVNSQYVYGGTPSSLTWQYYCATYDGTYVNVYLNGSLVTGPNNVGTVTPQSLPVYFGKQYNSTSGFPNAKFNRFRIYNRALSLAEIQAIYNAENH